MRSRFIALIAAVFLVAACDDSGGKTAADYIASGTEHFEAGRTRAAAIQFKNAIQSEPQNPTPRALLAQAHVALDDPLSAEKELERAIELGDTSEETLSHLALVKSKLGKHDEILAFAQTYGEFQEQRYANDFLVVKALAYQAQGVEQTAQILLSRVLNDGPHAAALMARARIAVSSDERREAIRLLDEVLELEPKNSDALLLKGRLLLGAGETEESYEVLSRALEASPHSARIKLVLANVEINAGNIDRAKELLDQVSSIAGADPRVRYLRAYVALQEEDYDTARNLADNVLGSAPRYAPALAVAGSSTLALGHLELAREYFNKYLAERPEDARISLLLARVQLELGERQTAVATLADLQSNDRPLDFGSLDRAAFLTLSAREPRLTVAFVDEILRRFPQSKRAKRIQADLAYQTDELSASRRVFVANENHRQVLPDQEEPLLSSDDLKAAEQTASERPQELISAYYRTVVADSHVSQGYGQLSADGQKDDAKAAFIKALEAEPSNRDAAAALAYLLAEKGEKQDAAAVLHPVLAVYPNDQALKEIYTALSGEGGEAVESLQEILAARRALEADANYAAVGAPQPTLASTESGAEINFENATPEQFHAQILALLNQRRLELAAKLAEEFRTRFPDDPVAYNDTALVYLAENKTAEAIANYRKALEIEPGNSAAALTVSQVQSAQGDLEGAAQTLADFLAHRPDHGRARIEYSEIQAKLGKTESAEKILRDTIELYPEVIEPRIVLARFLAVRDRPQEAIELLQGAPEEASSDATYLDALAFSQLRAQEYAAAAATYEDLADLRDNPVNDLFQAAQAYRNVYDNESAKSVLRRLLANSDTHFTARALLAELLISDGELPQAEVHLETLEEQRPDSATLAELWGNYFEQDGDMEQAIAYIEKAVQLESTSGRARKLSYLQLQSGDVAAAAATIDRRLLEAPDDMASMRQAVIIQFSLEDYDQVLSHVDRLLELEQERVGRHRPVTLNNRAVALWSLERYDEARETVDRALALYPTDPTLQYTLGIVLLDSDNSAEALETLRIAEPDFADNLTFSYHLARALAANGEQDRAIARLEDALTDDVPFAKRADAEVLLQELKAANQ